MLCSPSPYYSITAYHGARQAPMVVWLMMSVTHKGGNENVCLIEVGTVETIGYCGNKPPIGAIWHL